MTTADAGAPEPGGTAGRAPGPNSRHSRRQRSVTESLASIILGFESIVVFLASLVIFGLKAVDPPWAALIGGGVVFLAMVATLGLLRHRWAIAIGWLLQFVIVASGVLVPLMFLVGALFAGIWAYGIITGTRLDSRPRPAA